MKLRLIIFIKPLSKDNVKATTVIRKGDKLVAVNYLPEYYKQYEESIRNQVREITECMNLTDLPIKTPITITRLDIYFDENKSYLKADYFNYTKSLFDALNNFLWKDDSQITGFNGTGKKFLDENNPRFELEIEY